MVTPGTQIGVVNNQKQGTGLATILPAQNNDEIFYKQVADEKALRAAAAAQRAKDAADNLANITKFNPDRWFKHEAIIQPMMNQWMSDGAKLMAAGVNPYKDVSPAAQAWRKQMLEIQGIANTSKQMMQAWDDAQKKLNGAKPDAYDLNSVKQSSAYFDMDPRDVYKNGVLPPPLIEAKPLINLQDMFGKVMSEVNGRRGEVELTDPDRWAIVSETLRNPDMASQLQSSLGSALAIMDPNERQNLQNQAQAMGKSEPEMLAYNYVKAHEKAQKPFNLAEWMQDLSKEVKIPYNERQGAKYATKKVDETELKKSILAQSDAALSDPKALLAFEAEYPRPVGMNDTDYRKLAAPVLANKLRLMVVTQDESKLLQSAVEGKLTEESGLKWIQDLKSPDFRLNQEAAGYLRTTPNIIPGMRVTSADVVPAKNFSFDPNEKGNYLVLHAEGAESLQKVKDTLVENGIPSSDINIEQKGTEQIVTFKIDTESENALLKLHDQAFKDSKVGYRGPLEVATPKLSDIIPSGKPQKTPTGSKPKSRF